MEQDLFNRYEFPSRTIQSIFYECIFKYFILKDPKFLIIFFWFCKVVKLFYSTILQNCTIISSKKSWFYFLNLFHSWRHLSWHLQCKLGKIHSTADFINNHVVMLVIHLIEDTGKDHECVFYKKNNIYVYYIGICK